VKATTRTTTSSCRGTSGRRCSRRKLRLLFDALYPDIGDFVTQAVWAAGDVLSYGNFNTYVTSKDLTKQEGLIFRHLLRLILLLEEFEAAHPAGSGRDHLEG